MKLLYISNSRIPTEKAYGHQIMTMCQFLAEAGNQVDLVIPSRRNYNFKHTDPFAYYQVKNNFKLRKIFSVDPVGLMKLPQGIYIKFQALLFIISLFFYLLFKKDRSEYIFYTRDEYLLPVLRLFSKRVVWEAHSLPQNQKHYLKYFNQCRGLIVLTKELKNRLISSGIKPAKILVSPDAVDLNVFAINLNKEEARKKLNLPLGKIIIGYTGSFKTKNMDKGIEHILTALSHWSLPDVTSGDSSVQVAQAAESPVGRLRRDGDESRRTVNSSVPTVNSSVPLESPVRGLQRSQIKTILFLAVGGSQSDIEYYQKLADAKNISKQVKLLSKVSQSDLAIYQQACDILLMPFPRTEHFAYFMSPLKMFEYMASGRPIIATDLPSIREVLNKTNGLLVKPDDPPDLARAISRLINHPDLGLKLAGQARQDVEQYTWEKRVLKIIEFIISKKPF